MYECNMYPLNVSQNTKFTLMMTTRAPEAWTLSQFPARPMLSACWGNHPRGPIKATHRQPLATPTSRRSSRSCHAASATPVQTKRRERTTSPCRDEAYLYIYLEHMQYRFIFSCGVGFFSMKLFKLSFAPFFSPMVSVLHSVRFLLIINTLPRHAALCQLFVSKSRLEPPDGQSSHLKSQSRRAYFLIIGWLISASVMADICTSEIVSVCF